MNFTNYTIKAQQAIQKASEIATAHQHSSIENVHLLRGIMDVDENVIPFLLKKNNINPEIILQAIDKLIESLPKVSGGEQFLASPARTSLQKANSVMKDMKDEFVSIEHLLVGILESGDQTSQLLKDAGLKKKELLLSIKDLRQGSTVNSYTSEDTYMALNRFARNLNDLARNGKLDPVIGRDEEIRRILQILSRRTKNNPILIGDPGVGKTAIAEGIAHRIIDGDIPENLKTKKLFSLDMGALIAGAKFKGEFEERLKSVIKEVINSDGEIILFIDEIHTLVGAGASEGALDAANILKPALSRGELRAIGATTIKEYRKYFEKDKALERRFQTVLVSEPDQNDAISILRGLKERYETHHHVRIKDEAIIAAVELSSRYITERFLPDKAIDLIDEAAAKLRLEIDSVPEELDEIERNIRQFEIEREAIKRDGSIDKLDLLSKKIADLKEERNNLHSKWKAEQEIVEGIQNCKTNIENYRFEAQNAEREGDFGKVAEIRYGRIKDEERKVKELQAELIKAQKNSALINEEVSSSEIAEIVSRWTGIPVQRMLKSEREKLLFLEKELHKRVIGQDEAIVALSDAIRRSRAGLNDKNRPIGSFIFMGTTGVGKTELAKTLAEFLFNNEDALIRIDMSEYQERHSVSRLIGAPPGYVGYEESGQLTEAVRRKPYSVILLDEIEKAHPDVFNILLQVLEDGRLTDNKGNVANFKNCIIIMTSNLGSHLIHENFEDLTEENRTQVLERTQIDVFALLRKTISPEFLNRIDEIIMFTPLNLEEIKQIVELQIAQTNKLLAEQSIEIIPTPFAIEGIAELGFDPQFGARPIRRIIQKHMMNELSKLLLSGKIKSNSKVKVDMFDNEFVFQTISE